MKFTTLDIGNTRARYLQWQDRQPSGSVSLLSKNFSLPEHGVLVISNVGSTDRSQWQDAIYIKDYFKNGILLDMPVDYAETLGADRLAAAYAVFQSLKNTRKQKVIIDAGTFITVDLIASSGFRGGFILPGYHTLLNSYQTGTLLPHLEHETNYASTSLPHTTDDAILSATYLMIERSIKEILNTWQVNLKDVVITGGDAELINKFLPDSQTSVELIHYGLKEFYCKLKEGLK
jgi:pantothenate kinase type III